MKANGLPPLEVVERMHKDKQRKHQKAVERGKTDRYWQGMLAYELINKDHYTTTEDATDADGIA